MEYRSNEHSRVYPYDFYPNNPEMPNVERSVFRNIIDGLLIEIAFNGQIKLEYDDLPLNFENLITNYWKVEG